MPINTSQISWREEIVGRKLRIFAVRYCDTCEHKFSRDIRIPKDSTKDEVWNTKAQISYELEQHKH